MDDALPAHLGENRVVIGWSALDIPARTDTLIAAQFSNCKAERARAPGRDAGGKAVGRGFD